MFSGEKQDVCELKAYAKINLGLDVLGRLPNGYHEVRMVMQTVGICDRLILEKAQSGITLTTDVSGLSTGEDNLICRAARLLMEKYGVSQGVKIHLEKRIPVAAGMAGGSTDAAAALKGINTLFGLGCSQEELKELGVTIGADVPYCVMGGTVLAEGIGERLTELPPAPDCHLLVAKPPVNVSTRYVYEHLDAGEDYEHPDIDGLVQAIGAGSLEDMMTCMGNVLETVTIPAYPVIAKIKERMRELGALHSMMSGSGPSVFGIFAQKEQAEQAFDAFLQDGFDGQLFVTELVRKESAGCRTIFS